MRAVLGIIIGFTLPMSVAGLTLVFVRACTDFGEHWDQGTLWGCTLFAVFICWVAIVAWDAARR
jgi:hypothetical protein